MFNTPSLSLMTSRVQRSAPRAVRLVLVSMLVALSATVALSAWARPGGGHGGGHGMEAGGMMMGGSPKRMDRMLDGLNATDAQRSQIKQIAAAAAAEMKTQHEARMALHEKSRQIFAAPSVDAAAAESVRQQSLALHDTASRRMLETRLAIANVLTPEQRAKIAQRSKERGERMKDRRERQQREQTKN